MDLAIALVALLLVALIICHDPPSGYNMGTGDSWLPALAVAFLLAALIIFNYGTTP